jgi:YfiH family protein
LSTSFLAPRWDAPHNIAALTTVRHGGFSVGHYGDGLGGGGMNLALHVGDDEANVMRNRALLREYLPAEPVWLNQVHGNVAVDAAEAQGGICADAIVASKPGLVCAIQTADCLPVLFADEAGRVVGAAHGGWRGLASGVLENTVARMRGAGAQHIVAWLGPAIGPQKFAVGEDVRQAFLPRHARAIDAFRAIEAQDGKYLADIYMLARLLLQEVGVVDAAGGHACTVSDPTYYSYRRDRITGRMATLIWIKDRD